MILYGASGHGKVVFSLLRGQVVCFFDDDEDIKEFLGCPVRAYSSDYLEKEKVILTIGNNKIRKIIATKISHKFGIILANSSMIDLSVTIGEGSQVLHQALLQYDVKIGNHVIVNSSSSVDHECSIGDYVHIGPNSTLCGNVMVGEGSLIGAGSVILPGVSIGKWCVIGAGAVIRKDVQDGAIMVGNPSKRIN